MTFLVALLGEDHEFGIRASPGDGIGIVRCSLIGMGRRTYAPCRSAAVRVDGLGDEEVERVPVPSLVEYLVGLRTKLDGSLDRLQAGSSLDIDRTFEEVHAGDLGLRFIEHEACLHG